MNNPNIFHNSHDLFYRTPFGALPCGSKVFIRIAGVGCDEINLELQHFNEEKKTLSMKKTGEYFEIEFTVKNKEVIWYYFSIRQGSSWIYYGNNEEALGGVGQIYYVNPKSYQITVYEEVKVPTWYKEGIMYQIFVDSFFNGNPEKLPLNPKENSFIYGSWYDEPMYIKDSTGNIIRWAFYGGNLQGVIEKLSYLKTLGVTTIYFNPIFEATSVHKYDTGNYLKIDSMFGDEEKFKELCKRAEAEGIRIILDGVFSHTGEDSLYFNKYGKYESIGAYQSKESPYYSWYRFKEYPNGYESWWGVKALPNVNELEPSYMDFIINSKDSVINKWLTLGASGWRLDVADELPDEFIEALKKKAKNVKEDSVLIGEVWEDASNKVSYGKRRNYLLGKELDSVMNYPFRNLTLDFFRGSIGAEDFKRKIMSLYENYPREVFYSNMNLLGTHDTERLFTLYKDYVKNEAKAVELLKLSSLLQMTFPGVPCIYYGDEAGLTGGKDPYNRKAYPWGKENEEILKWYRIVTNLRRAYEVFKKGDFKFYHTPSHILCFERSYKDEKALIILNRSVEQPGIVQFNVEDSKLKLCNIINVEEEPITASRGSIRINIKPLEGKVFIGTNM